MVAATMYKGLGIGRTTHLPGPDGQTVPLYAAEPVDELFA
jgi:hypothetical protein